MSAARPSGPSNRVDASPGGFPGLSPRAALRRYALVSFLTWFPPGLMMASMVLLMTSRGLDLAEVGVVTAVYAVVVVILELPTGGLADVAGRRTVLAASALVSVVALSLLAVAGSFWVFVLVSVLKGIARALSSGPAQAWYVDTLHAVEGPEADLKPGLARGEAMGSGALCLATLAGGFMPLVVPGGLAAPMIAAAVAAAVLFAVVLVAMPEPPRPRPSIRSVLRDVPVTVGSGLQLGLRHLGLRRLLFVAFTIGMGLSAIEMLTPGRLASLTGTAESGSSVYAVVAAAGFGASGLGSWMAPRVARLLRGPIAAAVAGTMVGAVAFASLAASVVLFGPLGVVAACAAYVVMFAAVSVAEIMRVEMMHRRVGSSRRATLMSVDSLQLQLGGVASALGLGLLASRAGTAAAWWVAAGVLLLSAVLYVRLPPARIEP
ncbi:MFS transporter [Sphaerisporangium perillae]|uniref:MFS transporter n=1 Tax=Sphaerisporangium perillae TaxID=2935860 RepID=UPI00200FB91F|nr:MFS transporter [Sphaerisporangium perillae]